MSFLIDRYDPRVGTVIRYLQLLNIKANSSTINETMQNHPDWPGLLCISDTLHSFHIPHAAGKGKPEELDQLPTPFLGTTYDRQSPLYLIKNISDQSVEVIKENSSRLVSIAKDEFLKIWNGVYLIAEPNEKSKETDFEKNRLSYWGKTLIPVAAIILLLVLTGNIIYNKLYLIQSSVLSFSVWFQYVLILLGTIISSLLLCYELDKSNLVLKKVCTGISKGNCDAILSSKQGKVFRWLSWSEVGFIYFIGGLLMILFSSNIISSVLFLLVLNMLAVPYTLFSIYYQWRIAKEWCILCLGVQMVLVLAAINSLVYADFGSILSDSILISLPKLVLFYLLTALIWYTAKPYFNQLVKSKITKREYNRIKYNTDIYQTLLEKQPAISHPIEGLGIDIGNPESKNTIVKVCNPYCGPCAKAHPLIESLVDQNLAKAKIIFTTTTAETDHGKKPVEHLLAVASYNNESQTKAALDDWYLPAKKDYEIFASKYPMNGELTKQTEKIEKMDAWCRQMQISYTPTIYINGHQLPELYSLEDLKYFLLE